METLTLLSEIKNHGLYIQAIDGDLHVRPRERITDALRVTIRQHKAALVDVLEEWEERAARMEFDAPDCYSDRAAAEAAAFEDCNLVFSERMEP